MVSGLVSTVRPFGTGASGSKRRTGRPFLFDGLRARVSSWPPLRLTRMRCERESVVVVCPPVLHRHRRLVGRREHASLYRFGCASRVRGGRDLGGRDRPVGGPDRDDAGSASLVRGEFVSP